MKTLCPDIRLYKSSWVSNADYLDVKIWMIAALEYFRAITKNKLSAVLQDSQTFEIPMKPQNYPNIDYYQKLFENSFIQNVNWEIKELSYLNKDKFLYFFIRQNIFKFTYWRFWHNAYYNVFVLDSILGKSGFKETSNENSISTIWCTDSSLNIIITTYWSQNQNDNPRHYVQLSIHELWHLFWLWHCDDNWCFMTPMADINQLKFCPDCVEKLNLYVEDIIKYWNQGALILSFVRKYKNLLRNRFNHTIQNFNHSS